MSAMKRVERQETENGVTTVPGIDEVGKTAAY